MLLSLLSPPLPLPPLLPPLSLELGDSGPAAAASSAGQGGWNLSLEEEAGSLFLAGMTFVSLSLSLCLSLSPPPRSLRVLLSGTRALDFLGVGWARCDVPHGERVISYCTNIGRTQSRRRA